MQSFIKIGGQVSEKKSNGTQKDIHLLLLGSSVIVILRFTVCVKDEFRNDILREKLMNCTILCEIRRNCLNYRNWTRTLNKNSLLLSFSSMNFAWKWAHSSITSCTPFCQSSWRIISEEKVVVKEIHENALKQMMSVISMTNFTQH